jgi:PAS domain S-box-containing protein
MGKKKISSEKGKKADSKVCTPFFSEHDKSLRQVAEIKLQEINGRSDEIKPEEAIKISHELQVHQIELELQNEELRQAYLDLEESHEKYFEFYNFAPVGYITLNDKGIVLDANLTAANLFGVEKTEILSNPFTKLIYIEDQDLYYLNRKRLIESGLNQQFELRLVKSDKSYFWTLVEEILSKGRKGEVYTLLTITDISILKEKEEALRKSEERFQVLFNNTPLGYQSLDFDGNFIEVNQAWLDTLGYTRGEVLNHWFGEFLAPEYVNPFRERFPLFKELGKIHSEFQMMHKNGERRFVAFEGLIGHKPDGTFKQTHCILQDITDRKKLEEELMESEEKYRLLHESMMDAYVKVDNDGYIIESNKVYQDMLGYTQEELSKLTYPMLTPEKWHDMEYNIVSNQIKTRNYSEVYQKEYIKKDGTVFPVELRAFLLRDKNDEAKEIWGIARDITKRKRTEHLFESRIKLLEYSEHCTLKELLQKTLDEAEHLTSSDIGFYHFVDEDQKHISLQQWSSHTKDSMCKAQPDSQHYELEKAGVWAVCAREKKVIIHNDYENLQNKEDMPEGHAVVHRELCIPIIRSDKVVAILGVGNKKSDYDENDVNTVKQLADIAWDMAEKMIAENALRKSEEDLKRTNSEKDKFFSIIAHDLRAPFTGFLGFTELMKKDLHNMPISDLQLIAERLNSSANNLFGLLTNLLEWANMQRGITVFDPKKLSIKKTAEENIKLYLDTAGKKGVKIEEDISEDIIFTADKNMLETILRNLVSNALKFTQNGGCVTLSANKFEENIMITVKDTGIGMSEELINDLFKIDKRTSRKGTSNEPSTGLGLFLCKEYADKHNGKIWVLSEEGKGSEFTVCLPIV